MSYFYKITRKTYVFEDTEHDEHNHFGQLAKLRGINLIFLRYQISIALDSHLKISSLFFIAILLLYFFQFSSLELLNALHISTRTFLSFSLTLGGGGGGPTTKKIIPPGEIQDVLCLLFILFVLSAGFG